MNEPIDWCKRFADMEANPKAMTPKMTVKQWIQAREHVYGCDACFNRMERVCALQPKDQLPERGMN